MSRSWLLLVSLLVGTLAEYDPDDYADYPLIWSAGEGDGEAVEMLLMEGVGVMDRSKDGETALHVAAIRGDLRTLRALLQAGAEVDARTPRGQTLFMTPTMWAVYHGHVEFVETLLKAGADPTAADENGKTLLTMCQETGSHAMEKLVRDAIQRAESSGSKQ